MSNTKFTPKPWHVSPDKESIRDAGELPIAYTESDYHSTEEQDANGNLIAAAPELYEVALIADLLLDAGAENITPEIFLKFNSALKAAIAKAEGKE